MPVISSEFAEPPGRGQRTDAKGHEPHRVLEDAHQQSSGRKAACMHAI